MPPILHYSSSCTVSASQWPRVVTASAHEAPPNYTQERAGGCCRGSALPRLALLENHSTAVPRRTSCRLPLSVAPLGGFLRAVRRGRLAAVASRLSEEFLKSRRSAKGLENWPFSKLMRVNLAR